jgi:hypothetical protein
MELEYSPFLRLPAEIRLRIYTYVVPDIALRVPFADYSGLLYSCKQIYQELEAELVKPLPAFFEKWSEHTLRLEFVPRTITEMRNMTFLGPGPTTLAGIRATSRRAQMKLESIGLPLHLDLNCLTIKSHRHDGTQTQRDIRAFALRIGEYYHWKNTPRPKRIVWDWSDEPCEKNGMLMKEAEMAISQGPTWWFKVGQNAEGKAVSATFGTFATIQERGRQDSFIPLIGDLLRNEDWRKERSGPAIREE